MFYIRRKADNLVLYCFNQQPVFKGCMVKPIKALDTREDTHEVIQIDNHPLFWRGGLWNYDGTWTIANQEIYDSVVQEEQQRIIQSVYAIRQAKIYQESIPYIFPGDTEPDGIQFRDEIDRQNIQDIGHVAQFHINNSEPDFPMFFMARSNTLKTFTATQALEMCALLKLRGDVIYQLSWELKQQIEAAQTLEDLYNININTGWPE